MPTRGVITYLAQDRHSSYGRDSLAMLRRSVRSLFEHYNAAAKDDVLFFHTGMSEAAQSSVLMLCTAARSRFLKLAGHHFETPLGTPPESRWKQVGQYSAGYRHMIRFYTTGIWQVVRDEGYEYVMRMDEDSLLWSNIRYNLFDFMASKGIEYAYRLAAWEHGLHGFGGDHFFRFPREQVVKGITTNKSTGWLLDSCVASRRTIGNFSLRYCGEPYGVYNNFFVSKVSFWHRPDVQRFLTAVVKSHAIYTLRFNDILWQSTAIKLYMLPSRVWMFQDFAYEHITFRSTSGSSSNRSATEECAQVGAFVLGSDGAKHEPARVRAREILRKRACLVASSVTRKNGRITRLTQRLTLRCTIARPDDSSALDAITFGGSVSTEQPFCDRVPAPYYCANKEDLLTAAGRFVNSEARRAALVCNQTQACAREGACPARLAP